MKTGSRDWIGLAIISLACEALRFAAVGIAPVRAGWAVDAEQLLTGSTAAAGLQSATTSPLLAAASATVWPAVIGLAALLWRRAPDRFSALASALLIAQYVSLVVHLALPTIPPVTAAALELTAPVADLAVWQPLHNPLATIPSLPVALATVVGVAMARTWRPGGLAALLYPVVVAIAAMQGGGDYLLGVLAGAAVGLAASLVAARRPLDRLPGQSALTAIAGVAALALVAGLVRPDWQPDRAFAERELGMSAVSMRIIGTDAYAAGDWPIAAAALEQLPADRHDAETLLMLGVAHAHQEHYQVAERALRAASRMAPKDPRPYYWLHRFAYLAGAISEEQLIGAVHILHEAYGTDEAKELARALEDLLEAPE